MEIPPTDESKNSVVQLSPEKSELSPNPETIVQTAPSMARVLHKFWPQTTARKGERIIHYTISGSLGVALLAGCEEFDDGGRSIKVSPQAKKELLRAVHVVHDIDLIRGVYPWPDSLDPQTPQFIEAMRVIPGIKLEDRDFDILYTYIPERYITVQTPTGAYLVTPPDSAAAYKLFSALMANNFLHKPFQLNREVPRLITAAADIYSEEIVWARIRDIFHAYQTSVGESLPQHLGVEHMLRRATQDPCLSPELKALLRMAADKH